MAELLIGCGKSRAKQIAPTGDHEWAHLTTLDSNPAHEPTRVWDLERLPYPFEDEQFTEIHAYEVLEHTGQQGNWRFFFDQFAEFYRILKPHGLFCGTVPDINSRWVWADPSHTRMISLETLSFLSQGYYNQDTAVSDFRYYWHNDFVVEWSDVRDTRLAFVLRKV